MSIARLVVSAMVLAGALAGASADESAAESANGDHQKPGTPTSLVVSEFATTGMVGSVVGITLDPQGRVYVTNTNRRTFGALDIRNNTDWLIDSLLSRSIEDKRALIHARKPGWKEMAAYQEQVICLEDTTGKGVADKRTLAFSGLNDDVNGVAAGILWYDHALYVTCYPGLYRLTDPDGDGVFDKVEELVHGFGIHVGYGGHDMHGPTLGLDGRIYWSQGDKGFNVTTADGRQHLYVGQGGVFRCEPDGSGFEVFAHGLRNPFELAFDDHGNLFTVDNDGDFPGERERFHFVLEGSDSAWRAFYQYRGNAKWPQIPEYNPWLADQLWKPPTAGQPAYLTPAISSYSDGPIGFKYNPGTALDHRYRGYFFLAESTKKITAFTTREVGAGFAMVDPHTVLSGPFSTGLYFGPDGALYAADWGDNPWLPHQKGRVIKLDDPAAVKDPERIDVRRLIGEGDAKRGLDELARLLGHADQRIRLAAQLELVKRGDDGRARLEHVALDPAAAQLARLHAIWGVGQFGRKQPDAVAPLLPLLGDADVEVRAQTAKVLGEAHYAAAAAPLGALLADAKPRPRLFAGIALAQVGTPAQAPAAVALLAAAGSDLFLRHAGVMALAGACRDDRAPLLALATHASTAVRLAAVVALRQLGEPGISVFLADADESVVAEAARAIHDDQSIPAALPALAAVLARDGLKDDALLRRAISANLRLGDSAAIGRLTAFARKATATPALRAEAIDSLAATAQPLILDRVQAHPRSLPARDQAMVKSLVSPAMEQLLFDKNKPVQAAAARLIVALDLQEWAARLTALASDAKADPELRAAAIVALATMKAPGLRAVLDAALTSDQAPLRHAALEALAKIDPKSEATAAAVRRAATGADISDQQHALGVLATLKTEPAKVLLKERLELWRADKLPKAVQLDLDEAVRAHNDKALKAELDAVEKPLLKADPRGLNMMALEGGDPREGERLLRGGTNASCMQCHTMNGTAPGVGPDLAHVGARLDRSHILTSMLDPQADIAEGYGMVSVTLNDGRVLAGALAAETATEVTLRPPGAAPQVIAKDQIKTRTKPISVMPPMGSLLSRAEMRHLVAYLSSLK